jgi:acyl dehydratase
MSSKPHIENRTYDEIAVGDKASLSRTLTWRDIELFAAMSGDVNPAHVDQGFARSDMFHKIIAHGMWGGALISTLLGTELPGPGTIYVSQTLKFRRPIGLGDRVTVTVRAAAKDESKHRITFDCTVVNQDGNVAISGSAKVVAPVEKICRERVSLPEVELRDAGSAESG